MLGHSQVWAICLGQEGVVRVEVVGGHSGCLIFSSQVLVKFRLCIVWVFFYDVQVRTTLFSQVSNYECTYLGIIHELM